MRTVIDRKFLICFLACLTACSTEEDPTNAEPERRTGTQPQDSGFPVDTSAVDGNEGVRIIRIVTEESPSWVAWSELEVTGTWVNGNGEVKNLMQQATTRASSFTEEGVPELIMDGNEHTSWNSGGFAPAYLEIDLGREAHVHEVQLLVAQLPIGPTRHVLQMGPSSDHLEAVHEFAGGTFNGQWLVFPEEEDHVAAQGDCSLLELNLVMKQTAQQCSSCQVWFWGMGVEENRPRLELSYEDGGSSTTASFQAGPLGTDGNLYASRVLAENPWWGPGACQPQDTSCRENFLHHFEARGTLDGAPLWHGLLYADLSSVPCTATITSARLHLHINEDEGLSNDDHSSAVAIHRGLRRWSPETMHGQRYSIDENTAADLPWSTPGGDFGEFIMELQAQRDFWDRGFHKANPAAWFDFTAHLAQLQRERSP